MDLFISVKDYSFLTNTDISYVYKLIKDNKIESILNGRTKLIKIKADDYNKLHTERFAKNDNLNSNQNTNHSFDNSMMTQMLNMLQEKDKLFQSLLQEKEKTIQSLVSEISKLSGDTRRTANIIANRFELERDESPKTHLTLDKKKHS